MELSRDDLILFASTLKKISSYDFLNYTEKSFTRRLHKVMETHRISFQELLTRIENDYLFREEIVRDITVNTTELFRDPKVWLELEKIMYDRFKDVKNINIWHAGSSSGQEIYSMIIFLDRLNLLDKARIYATDINTTMLKQASSGIYRYRDFDEFLMNYKNVFPDAPESYKKYFETDILKFEIRVKDEYLNKVLWAKHDLVSLKQNFGTQFDLIFCRNVLIYFNYMLQNRVFDFFYDSLKNSGMLVIGVHEGMIGEITERYKKTGYIYYKR